MQMVEAEQRAAHAELGATQLHTELERARQNIRQLQTDLAAEQARSKSAETQLTAERSSAAKNAAEAAAAAQAFAAAQATAAQEQAAATCEQLAEQCTEAVQARQSAEAQLRVLRTEIAGLQRRHAALAEENSNLVRSQEAAISEQACIGTEQGLEAGVTLLALEGAAVTAAKAHPQPCSVGVGTDTFQAVNGSSQTLEHWQVSSRSAGCQTDSCTLEEPPTDSQTRSEDAKMQQDAAGAPRDAPREHVGQNGSSEKKRNHSDSGSRCESPALLASTAAGVGSRHGGAELTVERLRAQMTAIADAHVSELAQKNVHATFLLDRVAQLMSRRQEDIVGQGHVAAPMQAMAGLNKQLSEENAKLVDELAALKSSTLVQAVRHLHDVFELAAGTQPPRSGRPEGREDEACLSPEALRQPFAKESPVSPVSSALSSHWQATPVHSSRGLSHFHGFPRPPKPPETAKEQDSGAQAEAHGACGVTSAGAHSKIAVTEANPGKQLGSGTAAAQQAAAQVRELVSQLHTCALDLSQGVGAGVTREASKWAHASLVALACTCRVHLAPAVPLSDQKAAAACARSASPTRSTDIRDSETRELLQLQLALETAEQDCREVYLQREHPASCARCVALRSECVLRESRSVTWTKINTWLWKLSRLLMGMQWQRHWRS